MFDNRLASFLLDFGIEPSRKCGVVSYLLRGCFTDVGLSTDEM